MRIASSPNLRIAAGLLLATLLSTVGYRVFRRWISHGLEVLLERADDPSWLANWDPVAGSAYHSQARTHRTKPGLIGSAPNNGSNTCAFTKTSNWIPNGDLDSAIDRLLAPRSPLAHPCTEHWTSQLRMTA
jgi:hypothetical protein